MFVKDRHSRSIQWYARLWCVSVSAALVNAATGCAPIEPPPPLEGVTDVSMQNVRFTPQVVTIKVGESVRWINLESLPVPHTSTSGDPADPDAGDLWDSGRLSPGQTFTHTFGEPGEFEYYCVFHFRDGAMRHAHVIVEP